MSNIEEGFAWADSRQRVRTDVRKLCAGIVKKHETSSSAEETLKVLVESVAGRLVFEVESENDIAIYLERLARRLRRGGESIEF
ncbi:hypothetical protein [Methylobacterium sp. CM6247]